MADDTLRRIFGLLDVLSVEVGATRAGLDRLMAEMRTGFADVRGEMRTGFARVEQRLGNLETRFEDVETKSKAHDLRVTSLESRSEQTRVRHGENPARAA